MKRILTLLILLMLVFQSCGNNMVKKYRPTNEVQGSNDSLNAVALGNPEKTIKYSISVEKIDSTEYRLAELKSKHTPHKIEKITDFKQAKQLLKGIVEFAENDEDTENHAVKKIHFRDGKEYGNANEDDYCYFVAYYPGEDILLCEGGHTTDVSFDLKNGNETEETGNPDLIISSTNKAFRINGHFGGQECCSYFIQRKMDSGFEKIIQLDEEFEKQTKMRLCTIGSGFWLDDKTIYLTESSGYTDNGLSKKYFRIRIAAM